MQKKTPAGFSKFSWALALFCLPSTLFPLALLVSPQFASHPSLTPFQINLFSIAFWVYPLVLLILAGVLYKLHQRQPTVAVALLGVSFVMFYALLCYILSYF